MEGVVAYSNIILQYPCIDRRGWWRTSGHDPQSTLSFHCLKYKTVGSLW